ncbi:hypothetical protein H8959_004079 [Pygathrix nigripes]
MGLASTNSLGTVFTSLCVGLIQLMSGPLTDSLESSENSFDCGPDQLVSELSGKTTDAYGGHVSWNV